MFFCRGSLRCPVCIYHCTTTRINNLCMLLSKLFTHEKIITLSYPLLTAGLGVHRTLFKSLLFAAAAEALLPSQPACRPIASALLAPATVPLVVRSSNRLAAGVSAPAASDFLGVGVQFGGAMLVEVEVGVRKPKPEEEEVPEPLMSIALARRLFEAVLESL